HFSNELFGQAIYETIPVETRARLHAAIGAYLESIRQPQLIRDIAVRGPDPLVFGLAHHFSLATELALSCGTPDRQSVVFLLLKALYYLQLAGDISLSFSSSSDTLGSGAVII